MLYLGWTVLQVTDLFSWVLTSLLVNMGRSIGLSDISEAKTTQRTLHLKSSLINAVCNELKRWMRVSALAPPLSGSDPWKDHKPANRLHRDSPEVAVTGCPSFLGMSAAAPGPFTGPSIAAGCVQMSDFPASLDSLTCVVSSPSTPLLHFFISHKCEGDRPPP